MILELIKAAALLLALSLLQGLIARYWRGEETVGKVLSGCLFGGICIEICKRRLIALILGCLEPELMKLAVEIGLRLSQELNPIAVYYWFVQAAPAVSSRQVAGDTAHLCYHGDRPTEERGPPRAHRRRPPTPSQGRERRKFAPSRGPG